MQTHVFFDITESELHVNSVEASFQSSSCLCYVGFGFNSVLKLLGLCFGSSGGSVCCLNLIQVIDWSSRLIRGEELAAALFNGVF